MEVGRAHRSRVLVVAFGSFLFLFFVFMRCRRGGRLFGEMECRLVCGRRGRGQAELSVVFLRRLFRRDPSWIRARCRATPTISNYRRCVMKLRGHISGRSFIMDP